MGTAKDLGRLVGPPDAFFMRAPVVENISGEVMNL
jgi:hypothetical protein